MRVVLRPLATMVMTITVVVCGAAIPRAQTKAETFVATAAVQTSTGSKTAAAVAAVLKTMADVGHIDVGGSKSPLKYAYERPAGGGRIITVITAAPIAFLGADSPGAKPKAGFDLALALLDLSSSGSGTGELAPAAKVRLTDAGAIQTEDYGAEVVRLTNVQVKK